MASTAATTGAKPRTKAKRGQPTVLDRPVPLHATILPSGEALAELVRTGLPVKDAAQALGLDTSGAYKCLGDGRVVAGMLWEGRLDPDQLTDYQRAALDYFRRVDQAEAEALALHTKVIQEAALGGHHVRKRTTRTFNDKGEETGRTETEEILPPDIRASVYWTERRRPDLFGRTERREHALVGGDATVQVASPRERLAAELEQIARRKAQGASVVAAMHGDVIDVDSEEQAS